MKNLKTLPAIGLCLLLFAACKKDKDNPKAQVNTDNPMQTEMDKAVHNLVNSYASGAGTVGFSIAFIERTGDTQTKALYYNYGETIRGNGTLPTSGTPYEIGSITKTFTAVATYTYAMQQYGTDYQKYTDQNPADLLPAGSAKSFTKNGVTATVRQLLNHTSGLERLPKDIASAAGYNASAPYASYDSNRLYSYLAANSPLYTPGTPPAAVEVQTHYSNLAYGVAGLLLIRMQHRSFQDALAATGMEPWFIRHTPGASPEGAAKPHNAQGQEVAAWTNMAAFEGAGGLYSSGAKLAAMLGDYLTAGDAGSKLPANLAKSMDICTKPTVQVDGQNTFGLGWEFFTLSSGKELTVKDGGTGGSTAFVAFYKPGGKAIVMLTNNASEAGQSSVFVQLCEYWFK